MMFFKFLLPCFKSNLLPTPGEAAAPAAAPAAPNDQEPVVREPVEEHNGGNVDTQVSRLFLVASSSSSI
ncbi:hypothetical protein L3Y34_016983 [Caenorhabditis briggsae]|uniref:Uncharacterized protein n=1 Tax=Caenorhabditis briggsae TaxID=6238 RepID=A0AAE9DGF9_CAEBR|nr:hypothetical protein L3Y34_016983 [Caenorhabditis briggsae]